MAQTITLRDLYRIQGAIGALFSAELDVRVSYRLRKFLRAVREELHEAEEARMGLIRKHSPEGPLLQETPGFIQFNAEWQELLESTVDLPEVHIALAELEHAHVVCAEPDKSTSRRRFLASEIADLDFLITDDPPEPKT